MSRPPGYYLFIYRFCLSYHPRHSRHLTPPPSILSPSFLVAIILVTRIPPLLSYSSVSQLINFICLGFSASQLSHLSQLHLYQLHLSQLSQLLNCLIYLNFIFIIAPSNLTIITISISSAPNYISLFITSLSLKGSPPALQLNPCRHQQVIPIPTVSPILFTDIPYLSSS